MRKFQTRSRLHKEVGMIVIYKYNDLFGTSCKQSTVWIIPIIQLLL